MNHPARARYCNPGGPIRDLRVGMSHDFTFEFIGSDEASAKIPAMLDAFVRFRDESAISAISEAVGVYRSPSDVATTLKLLNRRRGA
jgi:hypothetical protein